MKLSVSQDAARWYKDEMSLKQGDYIQFIVKLYGQNIHPNYSLGITRESPQEMEIHVTVEEITFYNEPDAWFLDGYCLFITLVNGDIEFRYEQSA